MSQISLRIGYVMQNGAPDLEKLSGPQLHTISVIKGFKNLGHSVRVFGFQNSVLGWTDTLTDWLPVSYRLSKSLAFRLIESPVRKIQSLLRSPYLGLFDSLRFADACRIHLKNCDALYERHGYMGYGGVIAAKVLGIPLILELNGNIIKEIDERQLGISSIQKMLGRWVTILTFRAADRVVVVSKALKQALEKDFGIPGEKISIVPNGANISLFTAKQPGELTRSQYNINGERLVTFVGSFEPWHGVDLLVTAFREVANRIPDSKLLLVGSGQQLEKTVQEAKRLELEGRVMFLGRLSQEQVASILQISEVVVAPYPFGYSDIVGSPLKLVEYMAAGKGIVASTAPIHEMIEHEKTGLRVPPANAFALAEGIIRLIEDDKLRNMLGKNAAERAKHFTWDESAKRLMEIINEEIASKPRRVGLAHNANKVEA